MQVGGGNIFTIFFITTYLFFTYLLLFRVCDPGLVRGAGAGGDVRGGGGGGGDHNLHLENMCSIYIIYDIYR